MLMLAVFCWSPWRLLAAPPPNIVFILADDLGYGDLRCLNPDGKIATPQLDRLAAAGMTFTDAHSSSSVCTPTRYGLLTGRYNWRSRLQRGVLTGYSPRLIEEGRLTVAGFLQQQGYATACVGKWHLGMDWPLRGEGTAQDEGNHARIDYEAEIRQGPNAVGFDHYFGISASLDMPPYIYLENGRTLGVPTVRKKWLREGPAHVDFEAIDVLPRLGEEAVKFIDRQAAGGTAGKPFFLYLPLTAPHTPILPPQEWQGRSGLNPYGDFVMQVDAVVGQLLEALGRHQLAHDTLVIFASDNGCSPMAGLAELQAQGHAPSCHFRGHKADLFEGGHRVPFLARWPARIKPGTRSTQLVCLNDLLATCAEILGVTLPADAGEDSVSLLPALEQRDDTPLREALVHHSGNGSFAIRQGPWKLCLCPDSGGWSQPRPGSPAARDLPPVQLYNLDDDIGETRNLQAEHPEIVRKLTALLDQYVAQGRSTPGPRPPNTVPVDLGRRRVVPSR